MKKNFSIFWDSYVFGGFSDRPHFSKELGEIALRIRKQQAQEYAKIDTDYKKEKKKLIGIHRKNG